MKQYRVMVKHIDDAETMQLGGAEQIFPTYDDAEIYIERTLFSLGLAGGSHVRQGGEYGRYSSRGKLVSVFWIEPVPQQAVQP